MNLLRQNPVGQILEGYRVLGVDNLVFFLGSIFRLDLGCSRNLLDNFFLSVWFALVLKCDQ